MIPMVVSLILFSFYFMHWLGKRGGSYLLLFLFFFLKIILCIDFLAVLGLPCCVDFSPVAAQGLLVVVVPPLVEHGLQVHRPQQLWHTGLVAPRHVEFSRPGIEPLSSALTGGFFTTEPPGKFLSSFLSRLCS